MLGKSVVLYYYNTGTMRSSELAAREDEDESEVA